MYLSLKVFGCVSLTFLVAMTPALFPTEVGSGVARSQSVEKQKITSDRLHPQLIALEQTTIEAPLHRNSNVLDDNSYYNVHSFEGKAGERVAIELISEEFDAYLLLFDSEGNKIAEDDDSGGDNNARIAIVLPKDGIYQVIANSYRAGEIGSYRLTWGETTQADFSRNAFLRANSPSSQINIRSGASTRTKIVATGGYGDAITILEEMEGSDRHTWYRIKLDNSNITGWVRGDFVTTEQPAINSRVETLTIPAGATCRVSRETGLMVCN